MVADGDKCFRARGIPDGYTEPEIRDLLIKGLHLDEDVDISIFSLARNPLRPDEQIATLTLSRIPAELSEHGQQHIDIPPTSSENRGQRREVVLDSHFEGFTPLHNAKDEECHMDIIALSGLNGHAFGSFKAKGRSYMWLRDSLPFHLQKARIFIYGYDTNPKNSSFQTVSDLESTFRGKLRMLREGPDPARRPFVIIAHSLGGIIAKAAVIKMAENTVQGDDATYRALRGILLFGVPSEGMDIESLVSMVPVSQMRALLVSLDKTNSHTLRELGENFPRKISQLEDFEAFNFYETRESPTAVKNDKGNFEMIGPRTVLVTPASATQGKLRNEQGHRVIALDRTHSEMIKFSGANDDDYETTLGCLKGIEDRIARQTKCLQSLSFLEQHSRELDSQITAADGTCTWIHEHPSYESWLTTDSGLLWIMGPPGAGKSTLMKFVAKEWRENKHGRAIFASFFVHGRGSVEQKSLLGIYRALLHQILPHCPGSLASLTQIYKSRKATRGDCDHKWKWAEEELREFFISTAISESPQRPMTVFIDALDEMGESPAVNLVETLQRLHTTCLTRSSRLKLCFSSRYYPNLVREGSLLVAVEQENLRDIDSFIEAQTALMTIGLSDKRAIAALITERAKGIFQWVSLVLDEVKRLRRQGQSATAAIARIKELPRSLKGVYDALLVFESEHDRKQTLKLFQWILFSSEDLGMEDLRQALAIDASMPHNTLEEITRSSSYYQLEDMPTVVQDLSKGLARATKYPCSGGETFFVETIHQSVNDHLLRDGLKGLARPLTVDPEGLAHFQISRSCIKLLFAILKSPGPPELLDDCSDENESSDENEEHVEQAAPVQALAGHEGVANDVGEIGLYLSVAQVIQEAILAEFVGPRAADRRRPKLAALRRRILNLIRYLNDWADKLPLAAYAQRQWLHHVMKVERYKIDQQDLLQKLRWRKHCGTLSFLFTRNWSMECFFERGRGRKGATPAERLASILWFKYAYLWDPVHLLALAGIHSALAKMEQMEPGIYNRKDSLGQTTLLFAIAGGNEKIVASAMKVMAPHHVRNDKFLISPLFLAVTHGREDWVRAIISKGTDLDQLNRFGWDLEMNKYSALSRAWEQKDEKVVKRLLSDGANPSVGWFNPRGSENVIHRAVRDADEWSKRMLPLLVESAIKLYPAKKLPNLRDNTFLISSLGEGIGSMDNNSTLYYAIKRNNAPLVQLLLDSGALQDRLDDAHVADEYVLTYAAAHDLQEMVKVLLNSGMNPNSSVGPLDYPAALGHSSVVRLLLDAGTHPIGLSPSDEDVYPCLVSLPPVRPFGYTNDLSTDDSSVYFASNSLIFDEIPTLEMAIRNCDDERTPLGMAICNGHATVVQAFLDAANTPETDSNARVEDIRSLPWDRYVQLAVRINSPDVVQVLFKSGVDPNTLSFDGRPLLHIAAVENFVELVLVLLQAGADPTLRDISGSTVLQTVLEKGHMEVTNILLGWRDAHGRTLVMLEISTFRQAACLPLSATRNRLRWVLLQVLFYTEYDCDVKDNDGHTALWYAVVENIPEIVHLLLNYGSNPNTNNRQGKTPLMRAASDGFDRILRRLLAHSLTDIAIEDEDGLTAIDHARRAGNGTAMTLLRKRQDDLLMERQNRLVTQISEGGRALPLQNLFFTGFMGTLRRHRH